MQNRAVALLASILSLAIVPLAMSGAEPTKRSAVDCLDCNACAGGTGHYHDPDVDWGVSAEMHNCDSGGPCSAHTNTCSVGRLDASKQQTLLLAMETDDAATIREFASTYPKRVKIDAERKGVHLLACNGSVFAFYPLERLSFSAD